MKWLAPLLCLWLLVVPASPADDALHREIRRIRRAFLDVQELLPAPEELDWYVVYNQNGYELAAEYLARKGAEDSEGPWSRERLLSESYLNAAERPVERRVLEKNVVYLAGLWKGELSPELFELGAEKFIKDALEISDENVGNTIDWMINALTCRPSSADEENELLAIFQKVSLKDSELNAWKTVLLHIFELHDCKFK